jgi:hypothetical protein
LQSLERRRRKGAGNYSDGKNPKEKIMKDQNFNNWKKRLKAYILKDIENRKTHRKL